MQDVNDFETEKGRAKVALLKEKLKRLNGDEEDGSSRIMKLDLPWEIPATDEIRREVKKDIFALGYE